MFAIYRKPGVCVNVKEYQRETSEPESRKIMFLKKNCSRVSHVSLKSVFSRPNVSLEPVYSPSYISSELVYTQSDSNTKSRVM